MESTVTTKSLKTKMVPIDKLVEDDRNPRRHSARDLEATRGSLKEFGQVEPLIVQKSTGRVINGNGRLQLLKQEGIKEAAVVELDIDDARARALGIALNRTGELASWNEGLLNQLLVEIQDSGTVNVLNLGFDEADLHKRLEELRQLQVPDGLAEEAEQAAAATSADLGSDPAVPAPGQYVRQINLFMPEQAFATFHEKLVKLTEAYKTANVTDTILRAVDEAHSRLVGG